MAATAALHHSFCCWWLYHTSAAGAVNANITHQPGQITQAFYGTTMRGMNRGRGTHKENSHGRGEKKIAQRANAAGRRAVEEPSPRLSSAHNSRPRLRRQERGARGPDALRCMEATKRHQEAWYSGVIISPDSLH